MAFLDIKISIEGNGLCTSVYYKPTDSHSYLLYSSSQPSLVKNSIPFSQFLRFRRLCSDDSDFSEKSETMCQFFDKRGYPVSVVQAGYHRAQQIDRQAALQTAEKENTDRIPFTLTFHPHNHTVKSIILKKFKLLQKRFRDWHYLFATPLISFKCGKNISNFLVRSSFQTNDFQMRSLTMQNLFHYSYHRENIGTQKGPLRSLITLRAPPPMLFTA